MARDIGNPPLSALIGRAIRLQQWDVVGRLYASIPERTDVARDIFGFYKICVRTESPEILLGVMLARADVTFRYFELIDGLFALYKASGRIADIGDVTARNVDAEGASPYWAPGLTLNRFSRYGAPAVNLIRELRYGSWTPESTADLSAMAETVAARMLLPASTVDQFHPRTRFPMERSAWERETKAAHAFDTIADDCRPSLSRPDIDGAYFDNDAVQRLRTADHAATGAIYLATHTGFMWTSRLLFELMFDNGVQIQAERTANKNALGVRGDGKAALFAAYRHLQEQRPLYIAVDGAMGATEEVEILGKTVSIGLGAAFLAFETKAALLWYTLERTANGLSPVVRRGPERLAGERYPAFKDRFLAYVAECLEDTFTGHPKDLVFRDGRYLI